MYHRKICFIYPTRLQKLIRTRQVYRQEGLRSFGRGYIPTVIGIFPYAGLDLFFAETARKYIQNTQGWAVNSGV